MDDNNTTPQAAPAAEPAEKSFTQDEVNAIVAERLNRVKAQFADYDAIKEKAAEYDKVQEANKSELEKAMERANSLQAQVDALTKASEIKAARDKVSAETNVPAYLLTAETEDALREQAAALNSWRTPDYPNVKDGGEPLNVPGKSTGDQFADWLKSNLNR